MKILLLRVLFSKVLFLNFHLPWPFFIFDWFIIPARVNFFFISVNIIIYLPCFVLFRLYFKFGVWNLCIKICCCCWNMSIWLILYVDGRYQHCSVFLLLCFIRGTKFVHMKTCCIVVMCAVCIRFSLHRQSIIYINSHWIF